MNAHALVLVLGSAALHVTWNFLAKKAQDQVAFMFLMMAVSPVIWLGPLLWMVWHGVSFGPLYIPLLGGLVQALYCLLMGKGYEAGDLSQVYPLARGLAPGLIAVIAWPLFGEGLSRMGLLGLLAILGGSLLLNAHGLKALFAGHGLHALWNPAVRIALLASVAISFYHITDKAGAMHAATPFAYLCAMHVSLVAFLTFFTLTQRSVTQVGEEWRRNWRSITVAGLFCFAAYLLVVSAMKLSNVAYVASLRNVSILAGVVLGATALGEQGLLWRGLGAACMLGGIVAIAVGG